MSYTNGEWRLDTLTGEVKYNGGRIAKVYEATDFNHTSNADECMANARLILSAPKMYKLLNKAHSILYRFTIEEAIDVVNLKTLVKESAELLARIDGKEEITAHERTD